MALAFIFPGQGSQSVGMGRALAEQFGSARAIFEEVDDALGQNLSKLMAGGPIEDITLTENAQPALMACSMAAMAVLKSDFDIDVSAAKYVAGHSLGEYSALCAAGVIGLSDTAKLLKLRGKSMQKAVAPGVGAMAALLGATPQDALAACEAGSKFGICQVANDNATGQIVLSGEKAAVQAAATYAEENGVKKAIMLAVSAPFHCSLMQSAAEAMKDALADTALNVPIVPVVNNVTARPTSDTDQIRDDLVAQVTGKVRWRESIEWMASEEGGVSAFAEPGTGKVLTVMLKRIVKGVSGTSLDTPEKMESFAQNLKG
ncbi:MAG: ACP S-malonyltransferase [Robiginitomaculum sp.]